MSEPTHGDAVPARDRVASGASATAADRLAPPRPLSIALMNETVGLGGAERVVLQLAEELRARGHRVTPVVSAGRDGWLVNSLRDARFDWRVYDPRRRFDPGAVSRLAATLRDVQADVVHSHEFLLAIAGTAAARRVRRPHIITMHGNQEMTRGWRRRVALRWAFRRSRATVAVSEDTRRHLETTLGLRPGVVQVIPNGIPIPDGRPAHVRAELGLEADELLVLAVGSLVPRKGHAVLIEALSRVRLTQPDLKWRLAIAGVGVERERLEALVRERGLDGRVHLLGPRGDVADLQSAAHIFVMPSLWEGLPLAVLEAMFAGNAIIASSASGIPEVIDHGREGLLLAPGDADALAAELIALMRDPARREEMGRAARERAHAHHTIGVMADAYERLYR